MKSLNNYILIGFMGVGKSTIMRLLSKETKLFGLDSDDLIESFEQQKIKDIFQTKGEDYFRECEERVSKWLSQNVSNTIIAAGGGFFMTKYFNEIGTVIYLKSSFEAILNRISKDELTKRPLFNDIEKAKNLFEKREKEYKKKADFTIDIENKNPKEVVLEIVNKLKLF